MKKETIGNIQIIVGIIILIAGILLAIYVFNNSLSEDNNKIIKGIGDSWTEQIKYFEDINASDETIMQFAALSFTQAWGEMGNINIMKFNLLFFELIIVSISLMFIFQGLKNKSNN